MTLSPAAMAFRTLTLEDLEFKAAELDKSLLEDYGRAKKGTKLFEIVSEIYSIYQAHWRSPNHLEPEVAARDFDYLSESIVSGGKGWSRPTILKAKRILGVRSVRRDGTWWWTLPLRAPEAAMQEALEEKCREIRFAEDYQGRLGKQHADIVATRSSYFRRPIFQQMIRFLAEQKYMVSTEWARAALLDTYGYKKQTVDKAKAKLGVVSWKNPEDGLWYWVYGSKEVQEWLLDELSEGAQTFRYLFDKAMRTKGWHSQVIRMARLASGGITTCSIDGQYGWRMR